MKFETHDPNSCLQQLVIPEIDTGRQSLCGISSQATLNQIDMDLSEYSCHVNNVIFYLIG